MYGYEFCQKQITECDRQLRQFYSRQGIKKPGATLPEEIRKGRLYKNGHKPQFDLRAAALFQLTGKDLTQIDGIDVLTATTILSETGSDMTRWQDENHFVSWL